MNGERQLPAGGLPPADLGKAFDVGGGADRRARLASILQAPVAPAGTEQAERRNSEPEPAAEPAAEGGDGRKSGADRQRVDVVDEGTAAGMVDDAVPVPDAAGGSRTKPVILYMPAQLRARLRRAAVGSTQLDVMLDAVEKTESAGVLGRLVREHQEPDTSGLFERQTPRGSETQVQVNVRARHQHIAVLDRLAARYSTNRSELVRVALDHVLPGGPRRHR
ncbi:hypothetical protein ACFV9C_44455 [Kribbella sp. NPDC059898]|uniref:hypothetical protein n=1 Tax=Kribbella sp. NPDC059898 TaxID=3346995 RepID=UPI0036664A8D